MPKPVADDGLAQKRGSSVEFPQVEYVLIGPKLPWTDEKKLGGKRIESKE
jgi:hypothetical protein